MSNQLSILESLKRIREDIFDDMGEETPGDKETVKNSEEEHFLSLKELNKEEKKRLKNYIKSNRATFCKGEWVYKDVDETYYYNYSSERDAIYWATELRITEEWEDKPSYDYWTYIQLLLGIENHYAGFKETNRIEILKYKVQSHDKNAKDFIKLSVEKSREIAQRVFGISNMKIRDKR